MIKCNSTKSCCSTCVVCMDGLQSHGGTIDCTVAENFKYDPLTIVRCCEYAEEMTDDKLLRMVKAMCSIYNLDLASYTRPQEDGALWFDIGTESGEIVEYVANLGIEVYWLDDNGDTYFSDMLTTLLRSRKVQMAMVNN